MLKLATKDAQYSSDWDYSGNCAKITENHQLPPRIRAEYLLLLKDEAAPMSDGFAGYILVGHERTGAKKTLSLPSDFDYLGSDDVVFVNPRLTHFRSLFRANTNHNSFLITERCNHYCVMCSQPPREIDDGYLASHILEAIPLLPRETKSIGITGGEPTLMRDGLIQIIKACKHHHPHAGLHILSNGTNFIDNKFAAEIAAIGHPDLMFGIPIYSNRPEVHNFVVQAPNALDSTIHGILNLKGNGVGVEIRVVLHKYTIPTLVELANFISTNLIFVDQIAFMGLEAMGFAKSNWNDLWIHPRDYQPELKKAATTCAMKGMTTLIYNLPLCWLDPELFPYSVKSISDWKNDYPKECNTCAAFSQCGGFFSSNLAKGATSDLSPFKASSLPSPI
jgi:His-Xaa-Ser system radical SAM maturase HxsC